MTSYCQQRTLRYEVPDNQLIKISDLIHLSSMKKNNNIIVSIRRIHSGKRPSKQWIYQRRTSDSLHAFHPYTETPDVFNQTDWKGMLSSSWLLNMKRLVIL